MATPRILVFSKTTGYRHDSIPAGIAALRDIAARVGVAVDATEDAAAIASLSRYQAVVFLQTTGPLLDAAQRDAMAGFITDGGGYLGVHGAIIGEPDWPFYRELLGAEFVGHPQVQPATVLAATQAHPATAALPARWDRTDEWYDFAAPPTDVSVLLTVDESSYDGGATGPVHPLAWCHTRLGGPMFYTALGHTIEAYTEPLFLAHLTGALRYVLSESEGHR